MQQQPFYSQGGSSFSSMNFDVSGGLGLPSFSSQVSLASQAGGPLQGTDLNSPETFKQNMQFALAHVVHVQLLANTALDGIKHAYRHRASPLKTASDIAALKQALHELVEHLRHTGVGALPLEAPPVPDARSDEQLIAEAARAVQVLYERQKRIQDGAGVVAGLLGQGLPGSGASGLAAGEQSSQGSGARRPGAGQA